MGSRLHSQSACPAANRKAHGHGADGVVYSVQGVGVVPGGGWLPVLSEAAHVDGQRGFWSSGLGRWLCTGENVAVLCLKGFSALLLPQGQLFLFFFSDVISDCTEIVVVVNQEILQFKIINEQSFQTSVQPVLKKEIFQKLN